MLAQFELNPVRERALADLEQQTGEQRETLFLKMFDFYMKSHQKTFDFDLERMKQRLNDDFVAVPKMENVDELLEWLDK